MIFINSYWIASRCHHTTEWTLVFSVYDMTSTQLGAYPIYQATDDNKQYGLALRPVVILDNNINIAYQNGVWTVSSEE